MQNIHCKTSNKGEIIKQISCGVLDRYNWKFCEEDHLFLLFFNNCNEIIGAIEYSFRFEEIVFIEMIEVVSKYRNKGYGYEMISMMKKDFDILQGVPIPDSERLFIKCGFHPTNPPIWTWTKN